MMWLSSIKALVFFISFQGKCCFLFFIFSSVFISLISSSLPDFGNVDQWLKSCPFLIFNVRRKDKASGGNYELKFQLLIASEDLLLRIELKIKIRRKFLKKGMISTPDVDSEEHSNELILFCSSCNSSLSINSTFFPISYKDPLFSLN